MTITSSPVHSITISAPSNTLASLLAGMASEAWATLTVANTVSLDPSGSSGDGWLSQSPRGEWDTLHNLSRTWGACHGNAGNFQRYWMSGFLDSANSYITPIAVGGTDSQITHGFYGGPAIDQQTGDVYGVKAYIDVSSVIRYNYATGVQDFPFPTNTEIGAHCSGIAVGYHPGLYGGAGGLVTGSNTGIWTSRLPRTGTPAWNLILDARNSVQGMDDFPVCTYNRKDSCLYIGGGGGSGIRKLYKVAAGGTGGIGVVTQVSYPTGITLYEWTSNGSASTLTAAGDSSKSMVSLGDNGVIYQYNEVADSWAQISTVVPSALWNGSTANKWWNVCSVPAPYNCIICMQGAGNLRTTNTLYVWKH